LIGQRIEISGQGGDEGKITNQSNNFDKKKTIFQEQQRTRKSKEMHIPSTGFRLAELKKERQRDTIR